MQVNEKRTDNKSKKSKTIIVAAIVLMLCLITTCVVGTTLAKYTTQGTGNDSAQVAKWGVKIEIQGDKLFSNEYKNPTDSAVTVKSTSDVVAPGTSGSTIFSISGTPEVALNVKIDFAKTNDVYLGTYHPVVFELKQIKNYTGDIDVVLESGTLEEVETYLHEWSQNYNPNTVLDATFELSWEWAFDGDDAKDTLLGDLIAGTQTTTESYSTSIGYTLTVTATQND